MHSVVKAETTGVNQDIREMTMPSKDVDSISDITK